MWDSVGEYCTTNNSCDVLDAAFALGRAAVSDATEWVGTVRRSAEDAISAAFDAGRAASNDAMDGACNAPARWISAAWNLAVEGTDRDLDADRVASEGVPFCDTFSGGHIDGSRSSPSTSAAVPL